MLFALTLQLLFFLFLFILIMYANDLSFLERNLEVILISQFVFLIIIYFLLAKHFKSFVSK